MHGRQSHSTSSPLSIRSYMAMRFAVIDVDVGDNGIGDNGNENGIGGGENKEPDMDGNGGGGGGGVGNNVDGITVDDEGSGFVFRDVPVVAR